MVSSFLCFSSFMSEIVAVIMDEIVCDENLHMLKSSFAVVGIL